MRFKTVSRISPNFVSEYQPRQFSLSYRRRHGYSDTELRAVFTARVVAKRKTSEIREWEIRLSTIEATVADIDFDRIKPIDLIDLLTTLGIDYDHSELDDLTADNMRTVALSWIDQFIDSLRHMISIELNHLSTERVIPDHGHRWYRKSEPEHCAQVRRALRRLADRDMAEQIDEYFS